MCQFCRLISLKGTIKGCSTRHALHGVSSTALGIRDEVMQKASSCMWTRL